MYFYWPGGGKLKDRPGHPTLELRHCWTAKYWRSSNRSAYCKRKCATAL